VALETRESVALAFLALLQRLPPRQRAALLLRDVLEWSAEDVAQALDLSLGSVNSALHRARQTLSAPATPTSTEPDPETLGAYLRSWEQHDVEGLLNLVRDDVVFAMPPHSTWFCGRADLERFLRGPTFNPRWAAGFRAIPTRANGAPALAFYRKVDDAFAQSSLQVLRFDGQRLAEITSFIGPGYLRGFDLPEWLPET
jgi:RNA polymerase sigma-70 factor (ECF subfamily)